MKTLTKRYPKLQAQQISCHSAHKEDERMYPCGKCEKCRRIVGMLHAIDEPAERCGYTEKQIKDAILMLEKQSVKQLGSDANQLYHLLLEKKVISSNEYTKKLAKNRPEIMKLRFDQERSNLEDMPKYIRKPLFDILMNYADGAVLRSGQKWQDIKIDDDFLYTKPYKLELK